MLRPMLCWLKTGVKFVTNRTAFAIEFHLALDKRLKDLESKRNDKKSPESIESGEYLGKIKEHLFLVLFNLIKGST
jgi:hypothetical protein